jgi:citrate lyase subunit beta / citryl-CoA lyase
VTLLRTLLFVPGNRTDMLAKAPAFLADAIILDLEDSVPTEAKSSARTAVRDAIGPLAEAGRQVWVRVNSTYSLLAKDDCRAVCNVALAGILLPKADTADIVRYGDALLRDAEALNGLESGSVKIIAHIESATALLRAEEIARASERVVALAFGGEDYAADMHIERTTEGEELGFARCLMAVAARAAGVDAIDSVYPYLHDIDALERDARFARRSGYQGKLLIHPEQIDPVARIFTPGQGELDRARRIVEAYRRAGNDGIGAVQINGAMIDAPVAKQAEQLLERFEGVRLP